MIDIDHFKGFNDTFGHDGDDAILRALGAFLKKHVRGSDIACRYGGEEFIVILSPSTAEGARQRAETIREPTIVVTISRKSAMPETENRCTLADPAAKADHDVTDDNGIIQ